MKHLKLFEEFSIKKSLKKFNDWFKPKCPNCKTILEKEVDVEYNVT
jgi:hypothetical protein